MKTLLSGALGAFLLWLMVKVFILSTFLGKVAEFLNKIFVACCD